MNFIIKIRNKFTQIAYAALARPILFLFNPELVHNAFIKIGSFLGSNYITKSITNILFNYQNLILEQTIFGLRFRSPVGLAAGFDKNGEIISIMENVGFGFVEIGSITAKPCLGNPGKRLERLTERKSLWVNFGLNNKGAIENYVRIKNKNFKFPVGISVAKTNSKETTESEKGLLDYLFTIKTFKDKADFFVLNISCPNAYGGCDFSNPELFKTLAKEVAKLKLRQPVFIKLSPDLKKANIDKILKISEKYKLSGFICTNLSKKHEFSKGGLSGKAIEEKSNKVLAYVYGKTKKMKGKFIIIGTGGIFSAKDAYKKIKLGASLVQLITGMIYQGPGLIGKINHDLAKMLKKDGYKNIHEAIGKNVK